MKIIIRLLWVFFGVLNFTMIVCFVFCKEDDFFRVVYNDGHVNFAEILVYLYVLCVLGSGNIYFFIIVFMKVIYINSQDFVVYYYGCIGGHCNKTEIKVSIKEVFYYL